MTDIEHAKKYAEESISLAISMYNPKAEVIAETACLYGLTFRNKQIAELERKLEQTEKDLADYQFNYPTIKELQKENEELRNNGFTVSAMTEQQLKVALEKGEQLEKENAELKDNFKIAKDNEYEYLSLLTKAKELLKNLLSAYTTYADSFDDRDNEIVSEAEQFLNSEVEK